jgi:hypothetical protein
MMKHPAPGTYAFKKKSLKNLKNLLKKKIFLSLKEVRK